MVGPGVLSVITRKRGNPNWCRAMRPAPARATAFEIEVKQVHLMPEAYVFSDQLRSWCERNRNRFYIPEWLLDEWGILVDADSSGAA